MALWLFLKKNNSITHTHYQHLRMKRPGTLLIKIAIVAIAAISATGWLRADNDDGKLSYNMQRAIEAYNNEDYNEAIQYARAELLESPENPTAWMLASDILLETGRPGIAISATDKALRVTPKKQKYPLALIYAQKAHAIDMVNDTSAEALRCLDKAVELCPRDTNLLRQRANFRANLNLIDGANADLRSILAINPNSFYARMCLGRNAMLTKRYDEAIKWFNTELDVDSTYYQGFAFRAEAKMGLKQWSEAVADEATALTDDNSTAHDLFYTLYDSVPELMEKAVAAKAQADTTGSGHWYYLLGTAKNNHDQFEESLKYYYAQDSIEPTMFTKIALSRECDLMGLMQQSLDYARQAVAADSSKANSLWYLADTYLDAGMTDSALTTINQYIELVPDDYSGYYTRGMIAVRRGQYDKALNDFDFAVVLDDSFVNAHLFRGIMLNSFGRTAEARKEFESTVACDTGRRMRIPVALYYLGCNQEAQAIADSLTSAKDASAYHHLWAARYYDVSGQTDKAIHHIEAATADGYIATTLISTDLMLSNSREDPRYKQIMARHAAKQKALAQRIATLYPSTKR